MEQIKIGTFHLNNYLDEKQLFDEITLELSNDPPIIINFLNAHCFNISMKDKEYRKIVSSSNFILNDGIGIEIAARLDNKTFNKNLNGTDLIPKILENFKNEKIYLLGAKEENVKLAVENLVNKHGLKVVGYSNGYFEKSDSVVRHINDSEASILLIGMGVPIQEKWAYDNRNQLNCKMIINGGAIIDFLSENIKRAPLFMRKLKLEWLYRLIQEPKRLWKRYLLGNIIFFLNLIRSRKGA